MVRGALATIAVLTYFPHQYIARGECLYRPLDQCNRGIPHGCISPHDQLHDIEHASEELKNCVRPRISMP
jgi:hypothetical protein